MSKIAASGMPITPEGELSAAAAAARANPLDDAAFGAAVAAMRAQLEAWAGRAGGSTFAAPATTAPAALRLAVMPQLRALTCRRLTALPC